MPKLINATPKFLTKELEPKEVDWIRRRLDPFFKTVQKDKDGHYPATIDLLHHFVDFLGQTSIDYRDLPHECLRTTEVGVAAIYDMVRKEMQKRKATPGQVVTRQTKKKATPQKAEAAAASSGKQIKDAEPPVQIEAEYLQGGTDEKAVAYR